MIGSLLITFVNYVNDVSCVNHVNIKLLTLRAHTVF